MSITDFSKAFDLVSHTKLIDKLHALKFPSSTIAWMHSYLYNRRQRVSLRGTVSDWIPVTSGVPQVSLLGPLLFNIYISDLHKILKSENNSYVDAFKLFFPSYSSNLLQEDLDVITAWATRNGLRINPKKCAVMHFSHNSPKVHY